MPGQPAAARFRGGLGAGERRADYWRGVDHRVRHYRRGTTGDHRRTRGDPVTAARRWGILGLKAEIPVSWPGSFNVANFSINVLIFLKFLEYQDLQDQCFHF